MVTKKLVNIVLILSVLSLALFVSGRISKEDIHTYVPWPIVEFFTFNAGTFVEQPMPLHKSKWLFDLGIVDANNDNLLDFYTINHNWPGTLFIAQENGGYKNMYSKWGLDQSREFPGLELSLTPPDFTKSGLYIYWLGEYLFLRTEKIGELGDSVEGSIHISFEPEIVENEGFQLEQSIKNIVPGTKISDTIIKFSASDGKVLKLKPSPQYPIRIKLSSSLPVSHIFVGNQRISPKKADFFLQLRDRHGMAWADINHDDQMDVYISRGGMSGYLKKLPQEVVSVVEDELLLSTDTSRFRDVASELGIEKKACSGRHTSWVDFDNDGLLDLFVNCQDRGKVKGVYPKQLYKQSPEQQFTDVATMVGLGISENQVIAFEWFDADNDGDTDLLTHQDNGFFFYRNNAGRFSREFLYRGKFARSDVPNLKYTVNLYWLYDGQLTVADYDADGDMDVFSSSKKGNVLLVNEKGKFVYSDPVSIGLPPTAVAAQWVDYNNDGSLDLHLVPEGLFILDEHGKFKATNLLILPSRRFLGAIINWFDLDNDGAQDVTMALRKNPTFKRWWESSPDEPTTANVLGYRNTGSSNHWLQLKLIGAAGNRQAIGAQVTVVTAAGEQLRQVGLHDGAVFSQGHYRLYFGLGEHNKVKAIKIRWPDGQQQELHDVDVDHLLIVQKDKVPNSG